VVRRVVLLTELVVEGRSVGLLVERQLVRLLLVAGVALVALVRQLRQLQIMLVE